jgi:hypothetical protein
MIDAVVTWVDGNDLKHREIIAKYSSMEEFEGTDPKINEPTRFADNNEIWYCINSIRKYAFFIDKIFLVTDNQKPAWLNDKLQKDYNIDIVDHKVMFAGYQEYLPTFNSQTIESMFHKIPGLSEQFIYFNDDVILVNPVAESDYFEDAKLIYRGDWQWKVSIKQNIARLIPLNDIFVLNSIGKGFVGYRNEQEYFKKSRYSLFKLAHSLHPMIKSLLEEIFIDEEFAKQQLKYRFRNKKQYWPFSLAANIAMQKGLARRGPNDYVCFNCSEFNMKQLKAWLDFLKQNRKIKSICIQSLDLANPEIEKSLKNFLDDRLKITTVPGS